MESITDSIRRAQVLSKFLECAVSEINENRFSYIPERQGHGMEFDGPGSESGDRRVYRVMTREEADDYVRSRIESTVWAFKSDFLVDFVPDGIEAEHIDMMRGDRCEDFGPVATALVNAGRGMDALVESAIAADGEDHFFDSYDGVSVESEGFVIFRCY
jgi:hypothetical protein